MVPPLKHNTMHVYEHSFVTSSFATTYLRGIITVKTYLFTYCLSVWYDKPQVRKVNNDREKEVNMAKFLQPLAASENIVYW
jgi:hypothetical protein